MGWRFRRSVKVAPGIRLNFGKRGTSWSIGPRGSKINIGPRGVRQTVSIPGTGLSYSRQVSGRTRSSAHYSAPAAIPQVENPDRFGIPHSHRRRWIAVLSGTALFTAVFLTPVFPAFASLFTAAGVVGVLIAAVTTSHATRVQRELDRRQQQFATALGEVSDKGNNKLDKGAVERLLALQDDLALTDAEIGTQKVAVLRGWLDLFKFEESVLANGGRFPTVTGYEADAGSDTCLFAAPAFMDRRGPNDETGHLLLTNARVVFRGTSLTAIPWSKVGIFERDDRRLSVQRADRQTPIQFYFDSTGDAMKAEFVGKNIRATIANAVSA